MQSIKPAPTSHRRSTRPLRPNPLHPLQVEAYRNMTSAERLAEAFEMTLFVRIQLHRQLRALHPGWSRSRLSAEIAARLLGDT